MKKYSSPQSKVINKLTRSTHLHREQDEIRQGSLDFSIQTLQESHFKAVFRIFLQSRNITTKLLSCGFRRIAQAALNNSISQQNKETGLKIMTSMKNIFLRASFKQLVKFSQCQRRKKVGAQMIKNSLVHLSNKKLQISMSAILNNFALISKTAVIQKNEEFEGVNYEQKIRQMDQVLKQAFEPMKSAQTQQKSNILKTIKFILQQQIQGCSNYQNQFLFETRNLTLKFMKQLIQGKDPTKSFGRSDNESLGKLTEVYQHILKLNKGEQTNKKMKLLLEFENRNLKQKTEIIKKQFEILMKENEQMKKKNPFYLKSSADQGQPGHNQLQLQLSKSQKRIAQLQNSLAQQDKKTSISENNNETTTIKKEQIVQLKSKLQQLQTKQKQLQQRLNQAQKNLSFKQKQIQELSKRVRDVSKKHNSKNKRLSSIQKQCKRFNQQMSQNKSQYASRSNSVNKLIKESRQIYKNFKLPSRKLWPEKNLLEDQELNNQRIIKILYGITAQLTDLQSEQKDEIWRQMNFITEKAIDNTFEKELQQYIVLFISRKMNLIKGLELSSDSQKVAGQKSMKRFFRHSKPNTPKRLQVGLDKSHRTIKR